MMHLRGRFRPRAVNTLWRNLNTGILKEGDNEKRVSMVPSVAEKLIGKGYKISVEAGAGAKSGIPDAAYEAVGCSVTSRNAVVSSSELLFAINPPPEQDLGGMAGKMLVAWVGRRLPEGEKYVKAAQDAKVTLVDTTSVPRITIAQKMDVLSSQAKCAGHRAVLEGAYSFERFYQGEITAAGKYPPCHTMVLGIGVAGLAAMGTSSALGSVVRAWDVRDVSDQVKSMGGKWITVDFKEDGAGAGGYAKESSKEFQEAQKATFHKHCKEVDIVISTAAIPGRKSPVLIEEYMVKDMKPGSVIVDLAAAGGGNCTLTKSGEKYTTENGVTIVGYTDLAGRMGEQASSMYATNMMHMVNHVTGKEGASAFLSNIEKALADEKGDIVVKSIICCKDGKPVVAPPPPDPTPVKKKEPKAAKEAVVIDPEKEAQRTSLAVAGTSALAVTASLGGDPGFINMLNTFGLAGAAGYQVVWGVSHALHTPLMAVTNAISGLTAAGGLMLMGAGGPPLAQGLAQASVAISAVNIAGGFVVTKRMLDLFRKPGEADYTTIYLMPAAVGPGARPGGCWRCGRLPSGPGGEPHGAAPDSGGFPLPGGRGRGGHLPWKPLDPPGCLFGAQGGRHAGQRHWRHHLDRQSGCLRQAERKPQLEALQPAQQEHAEHGHGGFAGGHAGHVLRIQLPGLGHCAHVQHHGVVLRHGRALGGQRGRRRYALLHHRAELLLRLGLGG
ncbi:unnamed protein product [Effrenium voratum]|nr:unnamed protein product [Effrenium voratum]